ncbi:diguanylate cyclase (GGDEF) domain-containing protein [Parafrankia irregularis]|uniref:Diguanylate cyclase (GGDEF) domain-containing protein n=1 Tax=Parafrankia irregularis TaxID=795642 RepID=A0A0S4QRC3_9ACTN|nr:MULTISPECIES: diguanylate cyclase [Parafrankia]MBE3201703.1 diguanylate cyclase [Parafrankia sp. CH37]CUU57448.1 diguanylate cyclase (GGDEF) domain-containing protein [Parafrankia irregularis]
MPMDESGGRVSRLWPAAFGCWACWAFALLATICVVLLPAPHDLQAVDMACTAATLVATVVLLSTARRAGANDRRWRLLVALTTFGGFLIASANSWHGIVHGADVYNEIQLVHATFLLAYLPALAGLLLLPSELVLARAGPRSLPRPHGRHWYVITVLDSALIVGSGALVAWSTLLAPVVHRTTLSRPALAIVFSSIAIGLVLVVVAALLATARRPRSLPTLILLAAGMAVMSVTMGVYLYLAAATNGVVPAAVHLGYLVSWLLMISAALVPPPPGPLPSEPSPQTGTWVFSVRAVLPYLAFGAAGAVTLTRLATGARADELDFFGLIGLLVFLVCRQLATIGENARLLSLVDSSRRELHHQAFHDPLTGVANRALFAVRLEQAVAAHVRDHRRLAVLYCDIDDFKQINDNLGHSVGDALLQVVAGRLQHGTRDTDTVARLGGDEFAVVLGGAGGDPEPVARRLGNIMRAPFHLGEHSYPVGISLGLVVSELSPGAGDHGATTVTADSLLRDADIAMYAAKRAKRGGLVVRRAGRPASDSPIQLGGQLAAALRGEPGNGTLDVVYRDVVDLRDGRVVAFDAGPCWNHPEIGRVDAGRLYRLAGRGGLARAIDTFLLQRCCEDLGHDTAYASCAGVDADVDRPAVLVPISAGRAAEPSMATEILEALAERGLPPRVVVPAFSAGAAEVGDLVAARNVLGQLRRSGVRCALTEAAGDAATLRLLRLLPIDIIRLDAALTSVDGEVPANRDAGEAAAGAGAGSRGGGEGDPTLADTIRSALVGAAIRRGLTVIAPAVRGERQEHRLAADGCQLGEGPLYDRARQGRRRHGPALV